MTGPVERFARQIAGQGYIVAAPSSYHEFTGPEALAYDVPGTDAGNEWKITKVSFTYFAIAADSMDMANRQVCDRRSQLMTKTPR